MRGDGVHQDDLSAVEEGVEAQAHQRSQGRSPQSMQKTTSRLDQGKNYVIDIFMKMTCFIFHPVVIKNLKIN